MKKLIIISILLMGTVVFSQNKNQRATLKVDGVCLMCKNRIEKACIKTKGVKSAVWNVKTHELKLIFDERKTNIQTIEKSVLAVGHDTEKLKATDKAYQSIHDCCKYRDEEIIEDHN
ncbi:MAG: ATPase [Lutibacter sp.]|nr:MAG: ATPase [Lutibacter sp.]